MAKRKKSVTLPHRLRPLANVQPPHTPGHTVFQKDSILVVGDLVHGGALQLVHPEYNAAYDMDAEAARQSRCRILDYARTHRLRIYGMHLPGPGPVVLE